MDGYCLRTFFSSADMLFESNHAVLRRIFSLPRRTTHSETACRRPAMDTQQHTYCPWVVSNLWLQRKGAEGADAKKRPYWRTASRLTSAVFWHITGESHACPRLEGASDTASSACRQGALEHGSAGSDWTGSGGSCCRDRVLLPPG